MAGTKNAEIILGEGITEVYYFTSLRDMLDIKPTAKAVKPYNMEELEKAIKKYATEGYTKVHCLIDMDNKVNTPAMMIKYQRLKQKYDRKIIKNTDCEVCFYESFPSIELFFYYYFENSTAERTNNELKSWLNHKCGYETKARYSFHNAFIKNGGCLNKAITTAKNSIRLRPDECYNCSYTEVGNLIEYLGIKQK